MLQPASRNAYVCSDWSQTRKKWLCSPTPPLKVPRWTSRRPMRCTILRILVSRNIKKPIRNAAQGSDKQGPNVTASDRKRVRLERLASYTQKNYTVYAKSCVLAGGGREEYFRGVSASKGAHAYVVHFGFFWVADACNVAHALCVQFRIVLHRGMLRRSHACPSDRSRKQKGKQKQNMYTLPPECCAVVVRALRIGAKRKRK